MAAAQSFAEYRRGGSIDFEVLTRPRACHVESGRTNSSQPGAKPFGCRGMCELLQIEMEHSLAGPDSLLKCKKRPSERRTVGQDKGGIGVAGVEGGGDWRVGGGGLGAP